MSFRFIQSLAQCWARNPSICYLSLWSSGSHSRAHIYNSPSAFPTTTKLSAWYSGIGLGGVLALLAFAFYAFHTSLGGQPMFGRASLED